MDCLWLQGRVSNTVFTLACQNRSKRSRTILMYSVNTTVLFRSRPVRYKQCWRAVGGTKILWLEYQGECNKQGTIKPVNNAVVKLKNYAVSMKK